MKILVQVLAATLVLLLVVLAGLLLLLPPIARSEAVQSRLEEIARKATGRDVTWSDLDVGLLPPRLRVVNPDVASPPPSPRAGATNETASFGAEEVALVVALRPLLSGVVIVDQVRISGARATLVRTDAGIRHPLSTASENPRAESASDPLAPKSELPAPPTAATADPSHEPDADDLAFDVRDVVIAGSELRLEDRTLDPPVTWVLSDVSGSGRGELVRGQMDFEISAKIGSGGTLEIVGETRSDGEAEAHFDLLGFELATIQPYVGAETRLAGATSGRATWTRKPGDTITAQFRLDDARIATPDVQVNGVLEIGLAPLALDGPLLADIQVDLLSGTLRAQDAELDGPARVRASNVDLAGPLRADLDIDASAAALRSGDTFGKAPGVAATLRGPVSTGQNGFTLGPARLILGDTEVGFEARTGARTQVVLDPTRLDLEALAVHAPAIRDTGATGIVQLGRLEIRTEPLSVKGTVTLNGIRVLRDDTPELTVTGAIRATGDVLHAPDLLVGLAEQEIHLDAKLLGLGGEARHEIGIRADGVDSLALIRAFDPSHDTLSGRLDLTGRVRGPLDDAPLAAIVGDVRFAIAPGRLKNVSILKLAFDDLATGAAAAAIAGRGGDLGRYQEDEFDRLGGRIAVAGGRARTEDLQLVYRHYSVDLRGTVGLVDQALDLTGEITIDPEIDAVLSGDPDPAAKSGRKRVFPLARVGGTIESPRVTLGDDAVFRFASAYIRDERRRRKWEGEIDERLGEGSGKAVLDVLDEVLRGGSR